MVDLPIKNGGSFHSYGTVYQGVCLLVYKCGITLGMTIVNGYEKVTTCYNLL